MLEDRIKFIISELGTKIEEFQEKVRLLEQDETFFGENSLLIVCGQVRISDFKEMKTQLEDALGD